MYPHPSLLFFFNDTATTEIYTLPLHDALPICRRSGGPRNEGAASRRRRRNRRRSRFRRRRRDAAPRSEEHTSELQSRLHLVCRLLLEKKKKPRESKGTPSEEMLGVHGSCVQES